MVCRIILPVLMGLCGGWIVVVLIRTILQSTLLQTTWRQHIASLLQNIGWSIPAVLTLLVVHLGVKAEARRLMPSDERLRGRSRQRTSGPRPMNEEDRDPDPGRVSRQSRNGGSGLRQRTGVWQLHDSADTIFNLTPRNSLSPSDLSASIYDSAASHKVRVGFDEVLEPQESLVIRSRLEELAARLNVARPSSSSSRSSAGTALYRSNQQHVLYTIKMNFNDDVEQQVFEETGVRVSESVEHMLLHNGRDSGALMVSIARVRGCWLVVGWVQQLTGLANVAQTTGQGPAKSPSLSSAASGTAVGLPGVGAAVLDSEAIWWRLVQEVRKYQAQLRSAWIYHRKLVTEGDEDEPSPPVRWQYTSLAEGSPQEEVLHLDTSARKQGHHAGKDKIGDATLRLLDVQPPCLVLGHVMEVSCLVQLQLPALREGNGITELINGMVLRVIVMSGQKPLVDQEFSADKMRMVSGEYGSWILDLRFSVLALSHPCEVQLYIIQEVPGSVIAAESLVVCPLGVTMELAHLHKLSHNMRDPGEFGCQGPPHQVHSAPWHHHFREFMADLGLVMKATVGHPFANRRRVSVGVDMNYLAPLVQGLVTLLLEYNMHHTLAFLAEYVDILTCLQLEGNPPIDCPSSAHKACKQETAARVICKKPHSMNIHQHSVRGRRQLPVGYKVVALRRKREQEADETTESLEDALIPEPKRCLSDFVNDAQGGSRTDVGGDLLSPTGPEGRVRSLDFTSMMEDLKMATGRMEVLLAKRLAEQQGAQKK